MKLYHLAMAGVQVIFALEIASGGQVPTLTEQLTYVLLGFLAGGVCWWARKIRF